MSPPSADNAAVRLVPIELSTFKWPYGPRAGERGVVVVYAVEVDGRWILFDTGIGNAHPDIAEYETTTRPLRDALHEGGVPSDRIEAIVNCHLHFDHCGQNAAFPGVPIFTQAAEWQAAHEPDYTISEWVEFEGSDYRLIDGGAHLLAAVSILPTPGHTPGHQALVIDTPDERTILAGQACFSPDEWDGRGSGEGREGAWDLERYDASIAAMKALEPDVVWFAHARDAWRRRAQ
jgi:N-acyl homoserine lactone hydrolase